MLRERAALKRFLQLHSGFDTHRRAAASPGFPDEIDGTPGLRRM